MKKVFFDAQLELTYFETDDIISTSSGASESDTRVESSSETVFDPSDGFDGEGLPF